MQRYLTTTLPLTTIASSPIQDLLIATAHVAAYRPGITEMSNRLCAASLFDPTSGCERANHRDRPCAWEIKPSLPGLFFQVKRLAAQVNRAAIPPSGVYQTSNGRGEASL